MISPVSEIATVSSTAVEPDGQLLAFTAALRRRSTAGAVRSAALRTALVVAVPAITVAWALPVCRAAVAIAVAVTVGAAVLFALRAARAMAAATLLRGSGGGAAPGAGIVGDELATWLEQHRRRGADAPMVQWLGRDVAGRLPSLPAAAIADVGRRELGRLRRLVPIVLLLLLCWLVAEWLQPPWPGVAGGGPSEPTPTTGGSGEGRGNGEGVARRSGDAPPPPTDEQRRPEPPPSARSPQPPPPPARTDEHERKTRPDEPAPLLELPGQQRFVVPEFVGDGPTRRARMHAAEIERGGGSAGPAAGATGGDADAPSAPPPVRETFERAAEAAQRARHVPDEEKAMVRRFFEILREKAK